MSSLFAFELTDTSRMWLIDRPLEIAVYIALAVVLRFALHKVIDRTTRPRPAAEQSIDPEGGTAVDNGRPPLLRRSQRKTAKQTEVSERRAQRAQTIGSVLKSAVSIVILIWAILQILGILGVNVAPFIASAGIVGLALGFGAQNLVRDFLSGVFMLLEDQYGVGDVVDLGDAVGTVESVGLRVTTIRDVGGTLWYCRNGEILRVGNMSQGFAVAVVDVPIAHNTDVHRAGEIALRATVDASDDESIREDLLEQPDLLGVNSVNPESIVLRLTVKTKPGKQWAVQRTLNRAILVEFEREGIDAPYTRMVPSLAAQ
ncbi:mechanosensitive ion channel family protein [Rhodococcus rhodnii]|uniref:Uncharacterized protein n=2 Tax=Rhodococcus rhodnii TaxID=38312 RepID=R7WR84_9NOCA|nr:mechanosensitive ion channel family protein [Rhodococcus rhodnii]EOM77827.1 hypothetical protein Rrhod_0813 [Rhodococcus rhodnii LMG 5362]TXG88982.1 mechanosensitive ion channel family protein [Rhodococcus rhodnii]